jgi:Delta3,5-Delta2,4-dienoyl-CoA isomerase
MLKNKDFSIMMTKNLPVFKTLLVSVKDFVANVTLNRPEALNAFSKTLFSEITVCFNYLNDEPSVRVVVLDGGSSKHFSAGLDLTDMAWLTDQLSSSEDLSFKAKEIRKTILAWQDSMSSLESCTKPVIACVHSGCIGAGVDLITAADIRLCDKSAFVCVKEVDKGIAADLGTLQRLTKVIGSQSIVREICFRANKVHADQMLQHGLVSAVFKDRKELLAAANQMALEIAAKSPVAIQMTKKSLVHALNSSIPEGLKYIADQNMFLLQSADVTESFQAGFQKRKPNYSKL